MTYFMTNVRLINDINGNNDIVIKHADEETCSQVHEGRLYKKIDNDPTSTLRNEQKLLTSELQPSL